MTQKVKKYTEKTVTMESQATMTQAIMGMAMMETVTHVAEATIAMAEVEETIPATTTEMAIATQEVRQRHLLGPEKRLSRQR